MLADALVYLALPPRLSVGPRWLLLAIVFLLLIPIVSSYHLGRFDVTRVLTFVANGVITAALIVSLALLILGLPQHRDTPEMLLRSATTLWITNVLVFALWYWKLDAGGPMQRDRRDGSAKSSFLFPQMLQDPSSSWAPHFVDYLFLAFNTSTAFSPTDTAVLSRGAKLGTMLQATISLTIVILLAARAVGIL